MNIEQNKRREEMLEKVRKVLAMARDNGGNENEKQAALDRANKLMAAYGIQEAEIDMDQIEKNDMIFGECQAGPDGKAPEKGKVYRQFPTWAGVLSIGIARFTGTITVRRRNEFGEVCIFQGEKNDVLFARWLFGALVHQIQIEQLASGWNKRTDCNQFRYGAAASLQARLKALAAERSAIYKQAQQQSGSKALMVVERKLDIIREKFGAQRTSTARATISGATIAGRQAGQRMNIPVGRPIGCQSQKMIGGN